MSNLLVMKAENGEKVDFPLFNPRGNQSEIFSKTKNKKKA